MNLKQLTYFCEIVETGSSALASARLYVAPTALSMQIAQLESELGGLLFDRSRRPMELTPLGQHLFPRAKEIILSNARLKEEMRGIASGERGRLAIGFIRSSMSAFLPRAIRRFREKYPGLEMELLPMQSELQPSELLSGRIQIGISRFLGKYDKVDGLDYLPLVEDPFVAALPENHPLAQRSLIKAKDLDDTPYVVYPKNKQSHYAEDIFTLLRNAGGSPTAVHEAEEIHIALGIVASGLGFCLVGKSVAAAKRSDVAFVPIAGLASAASIVAVTSHSRLDSISKSFLETLIELYS